MVKPPFPYSMFDTNHNLLERMKDIMLFFRMLLNLISTRNRLLFWKLCQLFYQVDLSFSRVVPSLKLKAMIIEQRAWLKMVWNAYRFWNINLTRSKLMIRRILLDSIVFPLVFQENEDQFSKINLINLAQSNLKMKKTAINHTSWNCFVINSSKQRLQ